MYRPRWAGRMTPKMHEGGSDFVSACPSTERSTVLSKRVRVLLATVVATMVLAAGVAWAEGAQALEIGPSPAINQVPDDTWMTNGRVFSIIRSGDYLYVGGRFTRVKSEVSGGQSFAATNLARFDADTGVGDPTWTPDVTGEDPTVTTVYALAASNGKIWVGGKFGAVDGKGRGNLAAIDPLSGNVDPTWKPRADRLVWSLAFSCEGSGVFVGGKFLKAAGSEGVFIPRQLIARFDATSGTLHPWAVPAGSFQNNDEVASDLAVTCDRITSGFLGPNFLRS